MFKGKVYIYKNVDGKEEKVTKKFDSKEDFYYFLEKNPFLNESRHDIRKMPRRTRSIDIRSFYPSKDRILEANKFKELEKELDKVFKKPNKLTPR